MQPDSAARSAARTMKALCGVAAVLALVVVATGISSRASDAARLRERADAQSVPSVVVVKPGKGGPTAALELPGRLEAHSRAPIHARVSGYLKNWLVDIGSTVKAGQLLAEIETPDLDQQLLQATADLASAKASAALATTSAQRWQALLAADAVSRQETEEKSGDAATKQAMVNAAQANLDRYVATKRFARIVAPFDGTVTSRSTDVGALINAGAGSGQELFVISDTRKLRVYVSVPQNYVSAVTRGGKAAFSVPEYPGRVFAARVEASARAISSASGSMLVQLAVDNAAGELLPGAYARVRFDLSGLAGTLQLPPSALIFTRSGPLVATVGADSKVTLKPVTIARDLGKVIEIAAGISADDRVVESPPDGIADGELVRVAAADAGAGGVKAEHAKQ